MRRRILASVPHPEFRRRQITLERVFSPRALFLAAALALAAMTLLLTLTLAGNGASAALPPDYGAPAGYNQNAGRSLPSFPANQNNASPTVTENYGPNITVDSYGVKDADGDQITLSLAGADAARFVTQGAFEFVGMLLFGLDLNATPDYEDPDDANEDGVYEVTIQATDDDGTTGFDVRVTVTNVDEGRRSPAWPR